jgi:putative peptide zinc metalloprotease protein
MSLSAAPHAAAAAREAPLYSAQWFRVAPLKPRLRGHVQIRRQSYRGERWTLLVDPASGRAHRLDRASWALVGLCNGRRTLDEIWQGLRQRTGDELPSQDETIHLLVQLHEAGLVTSALHADARELFARRDERERKQRLAASNPLSFRARLGDPAALLRRLDPLGRALVSPAGALAWLALVGAALVAGLLEAPRVAGHAAQWLPTLPALAMLWAVYPVMKLLHELAHGLVVRRLGGEVHDAGVSLLMFLPVPWVDASAANAMPLARHRMLVSAAGVLAELAMAAAGLLLWLNLQAGWLSDLGFALFSAGAISTVLANANPLLRLDGYYLVTDALQLPNLALRSTLWWRQWLMRVLLRVPAPASDPLPCARGERGWLVAYQPLSWLYRVALALGITAWLGSVSAWLGWASALVSVWGLLAKPVHAAWRFLRGESLPASDASRARRRAALAAAVALAALFVMPWPFVTTARGVVWLPEQAWIRTGLDGSVDSFAARDGERVQPGAPLLRLQSPELASRQTQITEQLAAARAEFYRVLPGAAEGAAAGGAARLDSLAAELATVEQQLAGRDVVAALAGQVSLPRQQALVGRWFERGETLGHVLPDANTTLRVAVAQADALLLRAGTLKSIEVRTADRPDRVLHARLAQAQPAVTTQLPSAALGRASGGDIDLAADDKDGRAAREPVALLDLTVDQPLGALVGGRAWVRFDHGMQAIGPQLWRRAHQLVLQRFAPQG